MRPIETQPEPELWKQFQTIYEKNRLAQALLLIGPQHAAPIEFAFKIAATLLCSPSQDETKPCGRCKSCRLLSTREHPDLSYLLPDRVGGPIKIEQIRELQSLVFTSAQLGQHRVVIINPADKMNESAANALLKLLEEPPDHLIFILIAEHLSTVPATILSRCQQWRLTFADILHSDYLSIVEAYSSGQGRGELFLQLPNMLQELAAFLDSKSSVCSLALKWSTYEFNDLLWLLYLITAQMISYQLMGSSHQKAWTSELTTLAARFRPAHLFNQLNQINRLTNRLNQNNNMNQLLVLENLLLGFRV